MKYRIFSTLNILGLALGISCIVFIYSYIEYELSFEKKYPKADRIFRITRTSVEQATTRYWAPTAPLLGPELAAAMPEIESYTRLFQIGLSDISLRDSSGITKKFSETHGFYCDPAAFEIFDIKFLHGTGEGAFDELHSMVISEDMAKRYFGDKNPVGKTLKVDNGNVEFVVRGVMLDQPGNSHLKFNYLMPIELFRTILVRAGREDLYNSRTWAGPYNYFLLKENTSIKDVESKMDEFTLKYFEGYYADQNLLEIQKFVFQPIRKIHLHSKLEQEIGPNSDVTYVYVFSAVAFLILIIGGVNYVNLSTAQSMRRVKEIGVRKIIGARRGQIMMQYFGESFLITFIAAVFAVLIIDILFPFYNRLSGLDYELVQFFSATNLMLIIALIMIMGFLAGLYPAIMASSFSINNIIQGVKKVGSFSHNLRKALIVLQFVISVFLIFSTIVLSQQIRLFNEIDLGFTKENVVAIPLRTDLYRSIRNNYEGFKHDLKSNPRLLEVSASSNLPGERTSVEALNYLNDNTDDNPSQRFIRVDADYLKTMKIELLEGEDINKSVDTSLQFIINESSRILSDIKNPIGQRVRDIWGSTGTVVGIVKDFNFASLHESIEPLVMSFRSPGLDNYLLFRFEGETSEILEYLEKKLKEYAPNEIFDFKLITEQWDSLYVTENKASDTFDAFTILALIISCIGLFGLSAYTAESRMKEMGIRKVHGAGLADIMKVFGQTFIKLIMLASVVALPVAWIVMERWLQGFEYRISLSWIYALYSLLIIFVISFGTILYQMIKVLKANPIEYIKYE